MKIRNGFVSNSSSSSFIIDLGKEVTSHKDITHLFKTFDFEHYDGSAHFTPDRIAKWVFYRMKNIKESDSWLQDELLEERVPKEFYEKAYKIHKERFPEDKRLYELMELQNDIKNYNSLMDRYWNADEVDDMDALWDKIRQEDAYSKYPFLEEFDNYDEDILKEFNKRQENIISELRAPLIDEKFKTPVYEVYVQGSGEGFDCLESSALYETSSKKWSTQKLKFYS